MDNFYQRVKIFFRYKNKRTLFGTNTKSTEHSIQVTIRQSMMWQQSHECDMFCCIQPAEKQPVQRTLMKNGEIGNKTTS